MGKDKERRLLPNELSLWHHVARSVEPLRPMEAPPPPAPKLRLANGTALSASLPSPEVKPAQAAPPAPTRALAETGGAGLDRNHLKRLRRGLVEVDQRIDLHGLTQQDAHHRLSLFLAHAQAHGSRCVLVVTGKGPGDNGVLKRMTPRWLESPPNDGRVLTYTTARPRHGGEGALYVLLRRRR